MANKKNFSNVNTNPVYSTIAEATSEKTTPAAEPVKGRRTYSEAEAKEFMDSLRTAGRKGVKLPRINLAFSPELYDYVRTMSKVSGMTLTEFVNREVQKSLNEDRTIYEKAIEFRNSL